MDEGIQNSQPAVTNAELNAPKSNKVGKILTILLVLVLIGSTAFFAYSWKMEKDKVSKFQQSASLTKELVETVDSNVYRQFTLVDERGHWISSITCAEIVASNNYQETKPEYVDLVNNGICDPFSDVYKPNYTAFTSTLQEKSGAINSIYKELGVQELPTFSDKPNTNYLFDTCWDIIEAGECNIDASF